MLQIETNFESIDLAFVSQYLSQESYWAKGRSKEAIEKSCRNSLCFSLFLDKNQIGFARVITDKTVFAYLCDVFIHPSQQGKGYGKYLLSAIMADPNLSTINKFLLVTSTASALYEPFGFQALPDPEIYMVKP